MTDFDRGYARTIPAGRADMAVDAGLRAFMLGVFNKVALGLVVSGALAWVTSSVPAVRDALFVTTPTGRLAGYTLLGGVAPGILAAITALAAGAILTMIADTMIPEAFEQTHLAMGLITLLGFLTAFALSRAG